MYQEFKKSFQKIKYHAPDTLQNDILRAISAKEKKSLRIKFWSYSFLGALSLVGLVPAFKALVIQFAQSGFGQYLSLAFSGGGILAGGGKEVALSLVESLPTFGVVLVLTLLFVLMWALSSAVKSTRNPLQIA